MGKLGGFSKIAALLEKHSDDAAKVLDTVNNPEMAVALTGKPREVYLNALDKTYGNQAKRAADMGFDLADKQFHGTQYIDSQIDDFIPSGSRKGDVYKYGKGVYTTPFPGYADQYAGHGEGAIYPVVLNKKNNFHPADVDVAKDLLRNAEVEPKITGRLRSTEEGLDLIEKGLGKDNVSSFLDANGYRVGMPDDGIYVSKPSDIRSVNAAFDPRFKNSSKLLAGVGAAPAANMGLENSFKNFREDIAKPLVEGWDKVKSVVTKPLSNQLNLSKDPSVSDDLKKVLDIGIDPTNLIGGVPGAVIGGLQLMGSGESDNKPKEWSVLNGLKKSRGKIWPE